MKHNAIRNLVLLGGQLDLSAAACDAVWMAEVASVRRPLSSPGATGKEGGGHEISRPH